MSEKEFIALYEQYLRGQCNAEEVRLLENYRDDFQWIAWTADTGDKEKIHDEIYHRLHQEIHPTRKNGGLFSGPWVAAAAVLFIAGAGILFFNLQKQGWVSNQPLNTTVFETRTGEKKQIQLQDGSIVWLNAESRLILAKDFNETTREVDLEGEAYFDVAHSKTKPFKVHTQAFNLDVLGTAFNVKAYPGDVKAIATLVRGSIAMRGTSPDSKRITLKPSEQAVFLNPGKQLAENVKDKYLKLAPAVRIQHYTQRNDTIIVETAWKNNRLEIYDQTFAELKDILERWYDIEIVFKSKAVKNYRFRANFNNENIIDVLRSLQKAQYFNYEMKDRTVTISE